MPMSPVFVEYLNTWQSSIADVLGQIAGTEFRGEILEYSAAAAHIASHAGDGLWLRFGLSKRLRGEQAFVISVPNGVNLGQMLMGEPPLPAEMTPDYRDALEEVFRQFAGAAAQGLTSAEGDAQVQWEGQGAPTWVPALKAGLSFNAPNCPPILIGVILDETAGALFTGQAAVAAAAAAGRGSGSGSDMSSLLAIAGSERNLELLMDVELQVTLRFGERELLLKDILDLGPGSVVELDRSVKDPAELLVTGRVVARGEVVIVDGNYGLRVTEVAPPHQRMEVLQ